MATRVYSESTDFPGGFNTGRFHRDIEGGALSVTLLGVTKKGDVITAEFDQEPSAGDDTTLSGLVSGHVPAAVLAPPLVSPETMLFASDGTMMIDSTGEPYLLRET